MEKNSVFSKTLSHLIIQVQFMWKWIGLFMMKNHLLGCLNCCSLQDCIRVLTGLGFLPTLLLKLTLRNLEAVSFALWMFLEVVFYRCKLPSMECYCHVGTGALNCYSDFLIKLQKQVCGTVGPRIATLSGVVGLHVS